jgi:signal transduction histidine kinase
MAGSQRIAEKTQMDRHRVIGSAHAEVRFAIGTGAHNSIVVEPVEPAAADPALREDLAQIVHDLKNPLSSIALEAEMLDARMECCDRADVAQAVGRILRNVTYLDRLIGDLMDACTLSNGFFALRRVPCDLRALMMSVIDRVVPVADRHRVFIDADPLERVVIDEHRIERVIANLLDNALKYTPPSAGIVIRLERAVHTVQISICDAGPGLTAADIATVFEPYQRASTSLGRRGSGLGLFVSKQIVEAHGGDIGVESVRGWGARFFFSLPLA